MIETTTTQDKEALVDNYYAELFSYNPTLDYKGVISLLAQLNRSQEIEALVYHAFVPVRQVALEWLFKNNFERFMLHFNNCKGGTESAKLCFNTLTERRWTRMILDRQNKENKQSLAEISTNPDIFFSVANKVYKPQEVVSWLFNNLKFFKENYQKVSSALFTNNKLFACLGLKEFDLLYSFGPNVTPGCLVSLEPDSSKVDLKILKNMMTLFDLKYNPERYTTWLNSSTRSSDPEIVVEFLNSDVYVKENISSFKNRFATKFRLLPNKVSWNWEVSSISNVRSLLTPYCEAAYKEVILFHAPGVIKHIQFLVCESETNPNNEFFDHMNLWNKEEKNELQWSGFKKRIKEELTFFEELLASVQ